MVRGGVRVWHSQGMLALPALAATHGAQSLTGVRLLGLVLGLLLLVAAIRAMFGGKKGGGKRKGK
ncbi:MAG: hypothetical protein V7603_3311 [Micromonosporaceae bacterium]|jgi:hypothetical protein